MWRNYWIALSFANLVYLRAWSDLLPVTTDFLFHRKRLPGINLYFAIAGDVLALSLLTFLLIRLAPKLPAWLQRILLVAAAAMVTLAIRSVAPIGIRHSALLAVILAMLLLFVAAGLAFGFSAQITRLLSAIALTATPCLAVTFAGSLLYLYSQTPLPPDSPLAPRLAGLPPARVLWIVFDEWDQRISFTNRAAGTKMPVLDRLAADSFTGTRALAALTGMPVSQMATVDAIPSLLYGKRVNAAELEDVQSRRLFFDGGSSTVFGGGDSIFARVRSQGWNAAAAGWYLPYCRVFASQLTGCYWDEMYEPRSSTRFSVPGAAIDETRMLFETRMFSVFGPSLLNVRHFAEYQNLLATARRYAADPSIALAFIHFNIPHVPYFYNPQAGRFGHYAYSEALYNDALQWVDRSVGEVLSALTSAGLDSKTAIILSSDHPLRNSLHPEPYVPFIVHLPGEIGGMTFTGEFSALGTANLALAIVRGEVKSPSGVMTSLGISRR